jgi:hypothetical protein
MFGLAKHAADGCGERPQANGLNLFAAIDTVVTGSGKWSPRRGIFGSQGVHHLGLFLSAVGIIGH